MFLVPVLPWLVCVSTVVAQQEALIYAQTDTFNSSFTLSAFQVAAAKISNVTAHNVEVALNFERSNYADGASVKDDPFYDIPATFNASNLPPPGTILKVEVVTNTSKYTLPPSFSMSRFLYTSETLNGSAVPASAYVLWPYTPLKFPGMLSYSQNATDGVFPVIGFAHGTVGQVPDCAPSHIRNLYDEFHEPFPLALAGYAVVATDYVGLGVSGIPSPYFVLPAQANDIFHAVTAAQKAFPDSLSQKFVVMGQSQGGGAAWAAAQRQAVRPVEGYLGTVAVSPFTNILEAIAADGTDEDNGRVVGIAQGLDSVLPSFQLSDWLTDLAITRHELLQDIGGCLTTANYLFGDGLQIVQDGWNETWSAKWYSNMSDNGGKPFAGPMLVLQGDEDPNAYVNATASAVDLTCQVFPDNTLQYIQYAGIGHVPALYAGQHTWLRWIADRFLGVKMPRGCTQDFANPTRGSANANGKAQNWFVEYDLYGM